MQSLERGAGHIGALNWHAVRLYRLSRRLWLNDRRTPSLLIAAANRVLTGAEIPPTASFGPGLLIMHGCGIVVHPKTRAGRDCTLSLRCSRNAVTCKLLSGAGPCGRNAGAGSGGAGTRVGRSATVSPSHGSPNRNSRAPPAGNHATAR